MKRNITVTELFDKIQDSFYAMEAIEPYIQGQYSVCDDDDLDDVLEEMVRIACDAKKATQYATMQCGDSVMLIFLKGDIRKAVAILKKFLKDEQEDDKATEAIIKAQEKAAASIKASLDNHPDLKKFSPDERARILQNVSALFQKHS